MLEMRLLTFLKAINVDCLEIETNAMNASFILLLGYLCFLSFSLNEKKFEDDKLFCPSVVKGCELLTQTWK